MEQTPNSRFSGRARRIITSVVVTTIAGLVVTTVVYAAVSFKGQGMVQFDRIKTGGLTVTGTAGIGDAIKNPDKWKPLKVDDSLKVTGNLAVVGTADLLATVKNTTSGKPVKVDDSLLVTKDLDLRGVLKNTATGKPVKINDSLTVTGNLAVTGSLTGGTVSNLSAAIGTVDDNVTINRAAIRSMEYYLSCVAAASQYTTYSESADIIDCWNTWMAGTSIPSPLAKNASQEPAVFSIPEGSPATAPSFTKR